ncbi:MAG TPA: hypothetical protein VMD97_11295 [Candidatus Aquilonibacter sp.]|nr:hypothetical protein [Candidatus Aquilonibacter sp.]
MTRTEAPVIAHSSRRKRDRSDIPTEWVRAGRILLLINLVVLIASAFTEHLWAWDQFLHGGQDFELSLLAFLAFICLILVFAQYFRRRVSELLDDQAEYVTCDSGALLHPQPSLFLVSSAEHPPGAIRSCCAVILRI